MYIVSVLSKNTDFLESLPVAILNYNVGNLKFYFFNNVSQLNQQLQQSGMPDLLLCDREFNLGEGLEDKNLHKIYLSEQGSSKDEIFIYMNMELFLIEIQRRISIWHGGLETEAGKGLVEKERRLTWFIDPTESEWGKNCYSAWIESRYKGGQKSLCLDFSRMGILSRDKNLSSGHSLSELLLEWLHKGVHQSREAFSSEFLIIESIKHPMDLEMLQPEFVQHLLEGLGKDYEEIYLYSGLCSEAVAKSILRYTEEIFIISDQLDIYESPLHQIEAWIKEIDPRDRVSVFHTRSDPNGREVLKKKILDRAFEKGRLS